MGQELPDGLQPLHDGVFDIGQDYDSNAGRNLRLPRPKRVLKYPSRLPDFGCHIILRHNAIPLHVPDQEHRILARNRNESLAFHHNGTHVCYNNVFLFPFLLRDEFHIV